MSRYVSGTEGIAILSNYERIERSLARSAERLFAGKDIQEQLNALCSSLAQSLFHGPGKPKRTDEIDWGAIGDDVARVKYRNGRYIDVELGALIEEVRVSPTSEDWFLELVDSVSTKYGLAAKVRRSDILSAPVQ